MNGVGLVLADTALKGLVLIAAAAIAAYALRKKSAAARHAVWTAAVLGHLALPVLTMLVPQWRIPLLPAPGWLATNAGPDVSTTTPSNTVSDGGNAAPTTGAPVASESTPSGKGPTTMSTSTVVGILWILGTALVLLRLAVGTWQVGRLAKHGDRVDDGEWLSLTQRVAKRLRITRPLTLLRGESLAVPITWGVVYPAVLLPPDSEEWPEERRRFVLVHEMAHVKRFDALTQLLAQITIALLWFDPFLWYAAHRMRVEREHACDDYVLRDGTTPSLYAGELLEMVQAIGTTRHENTAPAFAALAMARRSEFEGRMLAILDKRLDRTTLGRRHAILATVALVILVFPLAALRPFASVSAASAPPIIVASQTSATPNEAPKETTALSPPASVKSDRTSRVPSKAALKQGLEASGTSTDSARVLTQYARTDDEATILMALEAAKGLSSDTDRRVLLQTLAPRALGKRNGVLRRAFFDATAEMTSDTDLRVVLTTALTYARTDPEVTVAVLKSVAEQMSSDDDKRVTLQTAIAQKLLTSNAIRSAFMAAVRSMESDENVRILMQAAMQ